MKNSNSVSLSTSWRVLPPSTTLLKFVDEIAYPGGIALDLACGFGRNAILMAANGCDVICADRDLTRLRHLEKSKASLLDQTPHDIPPGLITAICTDLTADR